MNDKQTRLENFKQTLGQFVTEGLRRLRGEKAALVNLVHERSTGGGITGGLRPAPPGCN